MGLDLNPDVKLNLGLRTPRTTASANKIFRRVKRNIKNVTDLIGGVQCS